MKQGPGTFGRFWLASASRILEPAASDVVLTRCVRRRRHARAGLAPWRARSWIDSDDETIALFCPSHFRERTCVGGPVFRRVGRANSCRAVAPRRRRFHRTPLLRFLPLQRVPTAMRCPWEPTHRTIPLRRFRPIATRASAELRNDDLSPSRSGVALAVFRCANVNAAVPGVGLVARLLRRSERRFKRLATCLRSTVRAVSGETGPIALTSDPSHQALPHYIGRSRTIMHRRVP